jgi:hypothetical protein
LNRGTKNAKCWKLGIEDYNEDYHTVTPVIDDHSNSEYPSHVFGKAKKNQKISHHFYGFDTSYTYTTIHAKLYVWGNFSNEYHIHLGGLLFAWQKNKDAGTATGGYRWY